MAFKIALTAGHYKGTPGKRCLKSLDPNETREWVLNNRIADKIEKLLQAYTGYELLRTDDTTGETAIELETRTDRANDFKADFYLSIHHNGGINGGAGGGIVAIVYPRVNAETKAWQKALYDALIAETGLKGNRSTPLAEMDLHEVRETNMPAVLLELGFMDSSTDVPIILSEKFADQCAKAIVKVLVEKGGLKKAVTTAPVQTTTATTTPTPTPSKKTVDDLAKEVIAGKWGVGSERKRRLTQAGYDYNAVQTRVNELCSGKTAAKPVIPEKTIEELAYEVIHGRWGNGPDRKDRLTKAGYDYKAVQDKVNQLLG